MIRFDAVNSCNREQVLGLSLKEEQRNFVESVGRCLSDADDCDSWRPVALYNGDDMIGFAMYGYFVSNSGTGRAWLDRIFIDQHYQNLGFGKQAITMLVDEITRDYHTNEVYLSVYPDNVVARNTYLHLGFNFIGEKDINGEDIMVKVLI